MSKIKFLTLTFFAIVFAVGCSHAVSDLAEVPKYFWGSSTRALEKGRADAIHKTYHCTVEECFDAVVKLTIPPKVDEEETPLPPPGQAPAASTGGLGFNSLSPGTAAPANVDQLSLFIKERKRDFLVVMGVPNCVDTTEVGVFFVPLDAGNVRIELSSLSTKAKRNASKIIFKELGNHFPEIE